MCTARTTSAIRRTVSVMSIDIELPQFVLEANIFDLRRRLAEDARSEYMHKSHWERLQNALWTFLEQPDGG